MPGIFTVIDCKSGGPMATIDDWKKMAEDGLKVLKETAQDIAFNVEKQAKLGKKKYLDIAKIQRNIDKLLIEIGEYTYDEVTAGRNISKDDPFIKEKTILIAHLRSEIDEIEEEIHEIQKARPPKQEM
jgi:predicted  nucleic acid-binding Zn-ribbon protein